VQERGNGALRWLDRWIGVPLIATLSILPRRAHRDPLRIIEARSLVTLLKSAAIGDTVLLSAVVRELRARLPESRLRLACGSSNAALAKMVEGLDEVIVLPMSNPLGLWRMRTMLRSDVFIDFDSWPRINALIAWISGSGRTVGFRTPGQYRDALYDLTVDHSASVHEVENYRRLARVAFLTNDMQPDGPGRPWLRIPGWSLTADGASKASTVLFHMHAGGSQAYYKEWPNDHWAMLATALIARGYAVALSGGPADLERNRAFAERMRPTGAVSVLPVTSLANLAALLTRVAAVVTVDTGIAHLAGAAGAKTLVLHGPTSPQRWGALGPHVHFLKDAQTPWISLGFELTTKGTPVSLTVTEVLSTLLAAINLSTA
jgi:ADP-heptose:LPS heptosyltransferase